MARIVDAGIDPTLGQCLVLGYRPYTFIHWLLLIQKTYIYKEMQPILQNCSINLYHVIALNSDCINYNISRLVHIIHICNSQYTSTILFLYVHTW